jgi:hypothetical protein
VLSENPLKKKTYADQGFPMEFNSFPSGNSNFRMETPGFLDEALARNPFLKGFWP